MKVPSTFTVLAVSAVSLLPTIVSALTLDSSPVSHGLLSKRGHYVEDGKEWDLWDIMCLPAETAVCGDSKLTRETCADNCFCMLNKKTARHEISFSFATRVCLGVKGSREEQCRCKSKPNLGKCLGGVLMHTDVRGWPAMDDTDYACAKDKNDEKGCITL